jgi:hypothetical protein
MRDLGALFGSLAAGTSFLLARLCADAMIVMRYSRNP